MFFPITVTDPITKKERTISPEEQEEMLERGVIFSVSFKKEKDIEKNND